MSDRDALLRIAARLGLNRVETGQPADLGAKEYALSADGLLLSIGHGAGYPGFWAAFAFNGEGNATSHAVYE